MMNVLAVALPPLDAGRAATSVALLAGAWIWEPEMVQGSFEVLEVNHSGSTDVAPADVAEPFAPCAEVNPGWARVELVNGDDESELWTSG
jgi:hypothetical protein